MKIAAIFILFGIAIIPLFVSCGFLIRSYIVKSPEDTDAIFKYSLIFEKFRKTKLFYWLLSLYLLLFFVAVFVLLYAFKDSLSMSSAMFITMVTGFFILWAGVIFWQVNKYRKYLKIHPPPEVTSSSESCNGWQIDYWNKYTDSYAKNVGRDVLIGVSLTLTFLAMIMLLCLLFNV